MRFKRASKVEVMSNREGIISWQCGKIISGNGHSYSVKYDPCPGSTREVVVERVSRKAVRPCPPPLESMRSWVAGDVMEVFDGVSWKIGTVLKVLGGDHYLVRLLGVPQEFRVHKSNIRVRQSWQDNKWVEIGKGSGRCEDLKSKRLSTLNCYQKTSFQMPRGNSEVKQRAGNDHFAIQDNGELQEAQMVSSRTLKRASPYCSSLPDVYSGDAQKRRAIKKEGRHQKYVPVLFHEKVDAVAYPRENLGETYMHSSLKSNGFHEMERSKLRGSLGCSLARSSELNDSDSDACSVGSCSVISESPKKFPSTESVSSNAKSFYGSENRGNCLFPPKEEVVASVHRLELHAYCCTLKALHASGPLSWDQEALLTNLRIKLNISNDEHLMEFRNLISAGSGIHIS